jgi:CBS domain-containing protein
MASPTINSALKQVLVPHVPFSQMQGQDLDFLLANIELAYYAPGETVLAPSEAVAEHCFIVKQGQVRGLHSGAPALNRSEHERIAFEAATGDCFPVGALLAQRPVSLTYLAVGDTFCLLLPRARFDELIRRSEAFSDFCRRRLGSLLDLSRQQMQATYAAEASAERTMGMSLGALVRGTPVTCRPDDTLREAFGGMSQANVGSVLVTESFPGGEEVLGILTRTDLIDRVILPEVPLSTPIRQVMTRNVMTLDANATAADATLLMAEHSIRHIPVMQSRGGVNRVVGLVSERDLFALQRLSVRQLAVAIRRAEDPDALAAVAQDINRLSHHLVAQGVAAAQLTRLISHLNDQLTQRLLVLACTRFAIDAQLFCWLALGSGGRTEQTIATDQDNGILYLPGSLGAQQLLEFADWINVALAQAGFPLCKGNIMARNPQWCLDTNGWARVFAEWIEHGDPQALLHSSVFFDFRGIFGNRALATALREDVVRRAAATPRFLKQMADNALRNRPPAGTVLESLLGDVPGEPVDLKMHGTVPFVDAARIWSLAAGLHETNTTERLRRLGEVGRLPAGDVAGWIDAFEFLQLMRLNVQHRRAQHAAAVDADDNPNVVDPRELSILDRRILKEAFRQARKVQQRLELDYPG